MEFVPFGQVVLEKLYGDVRAPLRFAPVRFAPVRSALVRFAIDRFAFVRFAPGPTR